MRRLCLCLCLLAIANLVTVRSRRMRLHGEGGTNQANSFFLVQLVFRTLLASVPRELFLLVLLITIWQTYTFEVFLPSTSNYDRAYYSCNKDWTLVKILQSNNAIFTSAALARQILTTALKFKFADVIVNCCRILRKHSADVGDEKNQFLNYLEKRILFDVVSCQMSMHYLCVTIFKCVLFVSVSE